jgi:hypothetical protein
MDGQRRRGERERDEEGAITREKQVAMMIVEQHIDMKTQ